MRLFLHLILTVNYEPTRWRGVEVPRGARIASQRKLCKELKMSRQSIRTAIQHLTGTGEITVETQDGEYSVYCVSNFEQYQKINPQTNQPINLPSNPPKKSAIGYTSIESEDAEEESNQHINPQINPEINQPSTNLYTNNKRNKEYKEDKEEYARAREEREESADWMDAVNSYNAICLSLQSVNYFPPNRISAIQNARPTVELFGGWDKLFGMVEASDFLSGRSGKWSGCNFDWIIRPDNLARIMEGVYRNKDEPNDTPPASYDIDEIERHMWNDPIVYRKKGGVS